MHKNLRQVTESSAHSSIGCQILTLFLLAVVLPSMWSSPAEAADSKTKEAIQQAFSKRLDVPPGGGIYLPIALEK